MRIKNFALRGNGPEAQLRQCVMHLPVDEFDAAEIFIIGMSFQGAVEAIEDGQQGFHGFRDGVLFELGLIASGTLALVFGLGLQPCETVVEDVALRPGLC
jgi:hypothetical protein